MCKWFANKRKNIKTFFLRCFCCFRAEDEPPKISQKKKVIKNVQMERVNPSEIKSIEDSFEIIEKEKED